MDREDDRPPSSRNGSAAQSPVPPSRPGERDRIPRQSFWAAMPKRSVVRILVLLATLLGIIYLREQTSSIAGCMSNAFRAPAPASTESGARARIELRVDASGESPR
jgi:hypothetical protein